MGTLQAVRAILAAGLICGTLDGLSALALSSGRWMRLFQFIASGVLGPASFQGGGSTAALGIALHYSIALGASAVFFAASRRFPILVGHTLLCGVAYGVLIHLFMNLIVIPLSAIGARPFKLSGFLIQLAVHMIVVGPSIALSVRHFSR